METMPPEVLARLHGAIRSLVPASPEAPDTGTTAPPLPGEALLGSTAEATAAPSAPVHLDAGRSGAPAAVPAGDPAGVDAPADRSAWWQETADDGVSPTTDTVLISGVPVGRGSRVRLSPRARGTDAQDMFLAGRTACVEAVFHDVDGSVHLAVVVDDDPGADLHGWYGRFRHFRPEELEPLDPPGAEPPVDQPRSSRPPSERPEHPAGEPEKGRSDGRS
ncbi:hypothetical protein STVIR_8144 [Streptomyces viridochromogenes Tue57]|uniref:Uncharacterized protein n=1 Tax=Streptomyces viridochromogenes Tue57 TaxID=1160705 RepID=L8P030_STRVR|nr:hypothetical protein STVIR_8144 [Streptomyces viridochromogenes Tue57]